ncbi:type III-A CRISPR-associated RAMP protein Csm3 [Diplocloster agilis]|uniref:CRISPR system Cms endoribonuclease Csm3 n=1 Tax=Diplocloster agilis TaxID=2850323 RepID=A0A949JVJ5_9FIRM|nr:type III-A CRISPR-associated RAMP protein Csm3 [Diplocloster agilis]MBU9735434.1 type III-A CRISPR-associated RAMP protein Csm3 [Diplocloster agilis]
MSDKVIIKADLRVLTGLHIGGLEEYAAIGAVKSPVIRDKRTNYPIIPGSSLKGKIRALLARSMETTGVVYSSPNKDPEILLRMFGTSEKPIRRSRLQFADAFLKNREEFLHLSDVTEVKAENRIDRVTAKATPRSIERVVSGALFEVCIVYNDEDDGHRDEELELLAKGMKLLQIDYLGGHGTRGSGRVSFENIRIDTLNLETDLSKIKKLFMEVEKYELLSI